MKLEISRGQFDHRLDLTRDGRDYGITPHTDSIEKALTILYYLPRDESTRGVGTSTFISRSGLDDEGFGMTWKNWSIDEEFEEKNTAPFLPNAAFVFAPCRTSWQGARPSLSTEARGVRWFVTEVNFVIQSFILNDTNVRF